jgi:competence protein ComEA
MFTMFKSLITAIAFAAAFCGSAMAADVNQANQAELEAVKGIGTAMSARILDERKKSAFKDWGDLIDRVKGFGPGNAVRFSEAGLTVGGAAYKAAAPKTMAKADVKAEPKAAAKP